MNPRPTSLAQAFVFVLALTTTLNLATAKYPILDDGYSLYNAMVQDEKVTIGLKLPRQKTDEAILQIQLFDSFDVKITNCKAMTNCGDLDFKGTIVQTDPDTPYTEIPKYKLRTQVKTNVTDLLLDPQEQSSCFPIGYTADDAPSGSKAETFCFYRVEIVNIEQNTMGLHLLYLLKRHIKLTPNMMFHQPFNNKLENFFYLEIDPNRVKEINFIVTGPNNDPPRIYASSTQTYPKDSGAGIFTGVNGHLSITSNFQSTYYVGVTSSEFLAEFNLQPQVISIDGDYVDSSIQLYEGYPQKGAINFQMEEIPDFYKFTVDVASSWNGKIEVSVDIPVGELTIGISDEPVNTIYECKKTSTEEIIQISHKDDDLFDKSGTYYVIITKDNSFQNYLPKDVQYHITYSLIDFSKNEPRNEHHIMLLENIDRHGILHPMQTKYFKFLIPYHETKPIIIYLDSDAEIAETMVSLNQDNKYPTIDNNDVNNEKFKWPITILSKDQLEDACQTLWYEKQQCFGYYALQSNNDEIDIHYTIDLNIDGLTQYRLIDNKPAVLLRPEDELTPMHFYFETSTELDLNIEIMGFGKLISAYVMIRDQKDKNGNLQALKFPTDEDYTLHVREQDQEFSGHQRILAPIKFENRNQVNTKIVSLSVYFRTDPSFKDRGGHKWSGFSDFQRLFSIVASQFFIKLYDSQPRNGVVEKGKYQYYTIHKFRDEPLYVSLVAQYGDPDIYILKGKASRPTVEDHLIASTSEKTTEFLQVELDDIYPEKSFVGTWVIGIYTEDENARYQLTVFSGKHKWVRLNRGDYQQLFLKSDETANVKYFNPDQEAFNFVVNMQSGLITYQIYGSNDDPFNKELIKDSTEYNIDSREHIEVSQYYAKKYQSISLHITAQKPSRLVVSLTNEKDWPFIQLGMTYKGTLTPNHKQKYLIVPVDEAEDVRLQVNSNSEKLSFYASHNPTLNRTNFVWQQDSHLNRFNMSVVFDHVSDQNAGNWTKVVWDGQNEIQSNNKLMYILIESDDKESVDYSYVVTTLKSQSIVMLDGHLYHQQMGNKDYFEGIYYSAVENDTLIFNLQYMTFETLKQRIQEQFSFELYFRPDDVTRGSGNKEDFVHWTMHNQEEQLPIRTFAQHLVKVTSKVGRYFFRANRNIYSKEQKGETDQFSLFVTNTNYEYLSMQPNDWKIVTVSDTPKVIEIQYPEDTVGTSLIDVSRCSNKLPVTVEYQGKMRQVDITDLLSLNLFQEKMTKGQTKKIMLGPGSGTSNVVLHSQYFPKQTLKAGFDKILPGSIKHSAFNKISGGKYQVQVIASPVIYYANLSLDLVQTRVNYMLYACSENADAMEGADCGFHFLDDACEGMTEMLPITGKQTPGLTFEVAFKPKKVFVAAQIFYMNKLVRTVLYPKKLTYEGSFKEIDFYVSGDGEGYSDWVQYIATGLLVIGFVYVIYTKKCKKDKYEPVSRPPTNLEMKSGGGSAGKDGKKFGIQYDMFDEEDNELNN